MVQDGAMVQGALPSSQGLEPNAEIAPTIFVLGETHFCQGHSEHALTEDTHALVIAVRDELSVEGTGRYARSWREFAFFVNELGNQDFMGSWHDGSKGLGSQAAADDVASLNSFSIDPSL